MTGHHGSPARSSISIYEQGRALGRTEKEVQAKATYGRQNLKPKTRSAKGDVVCNDEGVDEGDEIPPHTPE